MTARPLHVAIVGYGTAGQAAAILLARDGHRVEVFEQSAALGPVGAGVLLQPVGLQVLWELGLLEVALKYGQRVGRLHGATRSGRTVMDMRYTQLDARLTGVGMQRGALFSLLAEALPVDVVVHCGVRIMGVDDECRRIRDSGNRQHGPFDLVLAADGAASLLRAGVGRPRLDRPYPWGALWCLLEQADWPHVHELRRATSARARCWLAAGRQSSRDPCASSVSLESPTRIRCWSGAGIAPWFDEIRQLCPEAHERLQASIVANCSVARLPRCHRANGIANVSSCWAMLPMR